MAEKTVEILSYGGGKQTIAMCVLVAQGRLPRPDYIIAADTGREVKSTWEYLDQYARPLMASIGMDIHVAGHDLATRDLYSHNGDLLIPAFTQTGKLPTFCSSEWKARVVQRHARSLGAKTSELMVWIGFSLDETNRIKSTEGRRFPLVEAMLTSTDCYHIIETAGLPVPKKSRCGMCPHQNNSEWREVRDTDPELGREAISIDEEIRANDDRGGLYLHGSRVPLASADIDLADKQEPNRQCAFGLCFV